jgi:hypothetical protein
VNVPKKLQVEQATPTCCREGGSITAAASTRTIPAPLMRDTSIEEIYLYTHSVSEDRMAAAGAMLTAIFSHTADRSGLNAD